jgi:hypothetical protein
MSDFLIIVGMMLAMFSVVMTVGLRTSPAHIGLKVFCGLAALSLAFVAPFALNESAGYSVSTQYEKLPSCFDLIGFVAHDRDKTVDLMIGEHGRSRLYSLALDHRMTDALREARSRLAEGEIHLCKSNNDKRYDSMGGSSAVQSELKIDTSRDLPLKASGE